jgi:heterodisulfide reductase subunit A
MNKKRGSALVVGAGISGMRSALDLAETGYHVTLIDKAPNLGGTLRQLDYQFPNDHCGMCKMLPLVERDAASSYCLRKGFFHENIDIMAATELIAVEGEPGKFQVTLRHKPTLVDGERCIGCGECARVCPIEVADEFNAGLTNRKAVYLPVPHNIPNHYVVDLAACNRCGECVKACPTGAIDLQLEARKAFKILVVDDELIVRDSIKEWLEDEGFEVDMAESGMDALEKLSRQKYRLMLLDVKMPGMDGVEVLKRGREIDPDLSVVMMTAYATVETAVEAMKIGAMDYLMKPFDPEALVVMVVNLYRNFVRIGERKLEVGALVLAAGFGSFDPTTDDTYGYKENPQVLTSVEYERLISGTGPNGGKLLRPGDLKPVGKIAWLQCVGSRNLHLNADYCSSVCCMFSIKEALLAKEKSGGEVEAAIFYMDMRTFGKDFQRYRDRAENEYGVRFVRSRVHSVEQGENDSLRLRYSDIGGQTHDEDFDLVVLATGQKPPEATAALAELCGVELTPSGFFKTEEFSFSRTEKEGLFLSGSFTGLRDISESVIQASSASLAASSLIHSKGGSLKEVTDEPPFRDVSRELPQIGVFLCTCGGDIGRAADLKALAKKLTEPGGAKEVFQIERICTQEGLGELKETIKKSRVNRVLIGACMPYVYEKKLKDLGRSVGLHPSLIEVADIRTPAFAQGDENRAQVSREVGARLSMGISRLNGADPVLPRMVKVTQRALVVGGGIAGMTAALGIADHGYEVELLDTAGELGGNLRFLFRTLEGPSPKEILDKTIGRVEKHPNIKVRKKTRVAHSFGQAGSFITAIEKEDGSGESIEHGVTILATGGTEAGTESYGYGKSDAVVTQHELEEKLQNGAVAPTDLSTVVMIQCVGSREQPRNYCSRICCASALKNALYLKEKNPQINIYILYRDMMAYGFLEAYFTKARKAGVIFIQYDVERKPVVTIEDGSPSITVMEPLLSREILLRPDLLILSTGIVPAEGARELSKIFSVPLNQDGFYQEAEYKWRPVEFIKEGVFMCGIGHSPRSVTESIAMAEAAAQRALTMLTHERTAGGSIVAEVRKSLCSLCEQCIEACPYGARCRDEELSEIVVDELACQGCGACAAVCPNSAAVLRGYRDQQMFSMLDAALEEMF